MTLDAVCPAAADKAGERSGLCYECGGWRAFDGCIEHYGVCRQCRECLEEDIWDATDALLTELVTEHRRRIPPGVIADAHDILSDMNTVMGANAATDPRDTED